MIACSSSRKHLAEECSARGQVSTMRRESQSLVEVDVAVSAFPAANERGKQVRQRPGVACDDRVVCARCHAADLVAGQQSPRRIASAPASARSPAGRRPASAPPVAGSMHAACMRLVHSTCHRHAAAMLNACNAPVWCAERPPRRTSAPPWCGIALRPADPARHASCGA